MILGVVTHISNPGGRDWENCSSRPAWANSSQDAISKITRAKWGGHVTQAVECLLYKDEALSSTLSPHSVSPKKKKKTRIIAETK
jgi:hypothetical protein